MAKAADVRIAVRPGAVGDRNFGYFEVLLDRTEDEIEIAEGVKLAEKRTIGGKDIIVCPAHHLCRRECL